MRNKTSSKTRPHNLLPSDPVLRTKAMESLLINKGVIKEATLDSIVDYYQNQVGPINGAKIVAKAWDEPDFERVLIQKPTTTENTRK